MTDVTRILNAIEQGDGAKIIQLVARSKFM